MALNRIFPYSAWKRINSIGIRNRKYEILNSINEFWIDSRRIRMCCFILPWFFPVQIEKLRTSVKVKICQLICCHWLIRKYKPYNCGIRQTSKLFILIHKTIEHTRKLSNWLEGSLINNLRSKIECNNKFSNESFCSLWVSIRIITAERTRLLTQGEKTTKRNISWRVNLVRENSP